MRGLPWQCQPIQQGAESLEVCENPLGRLGLVEQACDVPGQPSLADWVTQSLTITLDEYGCAVLGCKM